MKRFKLFISITLVIAMVCSVSSLGANAAFTDVPYNHECLDGINYAVDNGIMLPTSATQFSPNANVTRAQVVYALYKESRDTGTYSTNTGFNDVSSSAYYASAVTWARDKGIAGGTSANGFSPNVNVKRQDLAVFLYRYANYMGHDTYVPSSFDLADEGYSDVGNIANYAVDAVKWAVYKGIVRGTSASGFAPNAYMARKWFANVLAYYSQYVERFVFCVDSYSFGNNGDGFPSSMDNNKYFINTADRQRLIQNFYDYSGGEGEDFDDLLNALDREFVDSPLDEDQAPDFPGACYGLAVTTALDKTGKININARTSDSTGTLNSIQASIANSDVESAINYYHFLQYFDFEKEYKCGEPTADKVDDLLGLLNQEKFVVFKYRSTIEYYDNDGIWTEQSYGHVIVITGYSSMGIPGLYMLSAYDNRYPEGLRTMYLSIDDDGVLFTLEKPNGSLEIIDSYIEYSSLDVFDDYDIDGYDNNGTFAETINSRSLSSIDKKADDHITMYIKSDDFIIKNSENKYFMCVDGVFSGELDIRSIKLIVTDGESVEWLVKMEKDPCQISVINNEFTDITIVDSHNSVRIVENGDPCVEYNTLSDRSYVSVNNLVRG